MSKYKLPKQLAKYHSISLKTVYNYLTKYPEKIRIKKEFWKRFVHIEDFTKVIQKNVQYYNSVLQQIDKKQEDIKDWKGIEELSKIQNDYNTILDENRTLVKRKDVLERQLNKYVELNKEQKKETKAVQEKFDSLQNLLNTEIKNHSNEKLQLTAKYYRLLILCVICLLMLFAFTLPHVIVRILPNL